MKTKRGSKKGKARQAIAISQIFIMLVASVAFAFIIGESERVDAAISTVRGTYTTTNGQYQWVNDDNGNYVRESNGQIHELGNTVMIGTVDANNRISFTTVPAPASPPTPPAPATPVVQPAPVVPKPAVVNTPAGAKPKITSLAEGTSKILATAQSFNLGKEDSTESGKEYKDVKRYEVKDGKVKLYNANGGSAGPDITDKAEIDAFLAKAGGWGAASAGVSTVAAFYNQDGKVVNAPATNFKNVLIDGKTYDNVLIDNNGNAWKLDSETNRYTQDDSIKANNIGKNKDLMGALPADTNIDVLKKLGWNGEQSRATIDGKAFSGTLYRDPVDASKAIFVDSNGNQKKLESSFDKNKGEVWKDVSGSKEDLTKIAGKTAGGHIGEALIWAGGFAGIVQILKGASVLDQNTADSLTVAGVAGILTWKGLVAIDAAKAKGPTFLSKYGGLIGLGVAAIVFWLMFKKTERRIVNFECLPFEPPLGGQKCEECNKDIFRPCSEYRCKALGGGCELLNPGTGKELCAWKSKFDVKSATIEPLKSVLYPYDLKYIPDNAIRPPMRGVKIVRGSNSCLQAFTPLVFGITTNKPTQCKIDYNHTSSYGEMQYLFGGENYYSYNHTQRMKLPTPEGSINDTESPELKNDGTYSLYVRCQDANGNQNVDEFVFSFCVDPSEDTTPPYIEKASIISGSPVRYRVDSVPIEVYVNEPADCKWSRTDKPYEDMENGMSCASDASQINNDLLYTCYGNLSAIKDKEDNKFFFRCKDKPGKSENERNVMVQSWPSKEGFVLKGSQPLTIASLSPNGTISGSTTTVTVNLQVETSHGAQEGRAMCMFSPSGANGTYINMYDSDNYISKQSLDLTSGSYKYYFRCNDAGGNFAENSTGFNVQVDKSAPRVTRVYKEVPDALKIITNEDAECSYSLSSCNFEFKSGIKMIYSNPSIKNVHFAEWKASAVYYVKCIDFYGNEPSPDGCSIIASAVKLTSDRAG